MSALPRVSSSLLFPLLLLLILTSCGDNNSLCPPAGPGTPPPDLEATPDTLSIDGQTLVLECQLWRDFMPIIPPEGNGLIALIRLTEIDALPIEANLDLRHLWVLLGSECWSTDFTDERRAPTPPHIKEKIARWGPEWETGVAVDVVVQVRLNGRACYVVKALDVPIHRTD